MRRVKVVYILGAPRSGSSLLASLLGELPGFFAAEMRLIWHRIDDRRCGCGRPVRDCPVLAPALAAAPYSGLRDEHDVLRVQDSTVRTCDLWRLLPRRGSGSPSVRAYRRMQGEMYNALAEVSDARVVVDSSKNPAEATLLRDAIDAEATVVHLVRDPRPSRTPGSARLGRDGPHVSAR